MKILIGALRFIGAIVSSILAGYLLWLLFHWLAPYIFTLSWTWMIILFVFCTTLIAGIIGSVATIIAIPVIACTRGMTWINVIASLIILFFMYSSIRELWALNIVYDAKAITAAILAIVCVEAPVFITLIMAPFHHDKYN